MSPLTLLYSHWFELAQTAAIAAGFVVSALSHSLELRFRRAEFAFHVTTAHRSIWGLIHSNPELSKVLESNRNPAEQQTTPSEEEFVLSVILHLASVHQAIHLGLHTSTSGMIRDVREFFSLPIPRHVLRKHIQFQTPEFQKFLHQIIR